MAQRRMFSPDIVESDAFLDMPVSSQNLYFHLGMRADDDGFVTPKMVMRLIGSGDDDIKVLITKRFILPFESGVVVIKHWLIHNLIRADLYKETLYKKEKETLGLNENGAYTELREGVSEIKKIESPEWLKRRRGDLRTANVPKTALRLGKDSIGKVRKGKEIQIPKETALQAGDEIGEFIFLFKEVNPTIGVLYGRPPQREAVARLLKIHPLKWWESFMGKYVLQLSRDKFCPRATTPIQMEAKLGAIMVYAKSLKENSKMITI